MNGIKFELVNGSTKKKAPNYLRNESNLLAHILDPSLTPTAQEVEEKVRNFAAKSETKYLKTRLKNHSINPKKYSGYLKSHNDNKSANTLKGQCDNLGDTNSKDENIFELSTWQKEIAEGQSIDIEILRSEYFETKSNEFIRVYDFFEI